MNHARVLARTSLAIALAMSATWVGAQSSAPAAGDAASAAMPVASSMTPAQRHDWERTHRVGRIIGSDIHSKSGEKVGDIRDLVVDDQGRILLAIVSTGGFLGVGDRLHAVPWDALTLGTRDDRILDIDKARLKAAPGFTSRTWPNLGDEHWMADNRRYYVH